MQNEKDIFSKLVEKAKTNSLTEREKRALFLAVDTYVENNPIYIKESASENATAGAPVFTRPQHSIPSPFMSGFGDRFQSFVSSWHIHSFKTVVAVFVIMIFGVGGSSLAAQNSLPGNFLYPIKVNINEGIKTAILSGPARASYEVERVKIRIDEAKQLVAQDKFTPQVQEQLATQLTSHIESVQKDINTLTKKGDLKVAFEISTDLEHSLEESQASVIQLSNETVSDQKLASINEISEIISVPLEISAVVRESTEDQISTLQANDESTKAIALAKLDSAKKIVERMDMETITQADVSTVMLKAVTVTSVAADVDAIASTTATSALKTTAPVDPLAEVRTLIQQGEEKLAAEEYNAAFSLFKEANDLAEKIQMGVKIEGPQIETGEEKAEANTPTE